jgi:hypothetical protein
LGRFGQGLFTPEGLFPYGSAGVNQLLLNYPIGADGFPSLTSSVGQGMAIVESTIAADTANGDASTVFGYSQSSTIASYVMQQLDPNGTNNAGDGLQFLLIGDPSAPNGGILERLAGFETISGQTVSDPLSLPSLGFVFDSATPSSDYTTSIFSLEYDGFTDFPKYPIDFLSDLNAFLGIATLHGTYLTDFTPADITQDAFLLPGSEALGYATDTNYYMIDQTAPLVTLLDGISKPLGDLLGPDLTILINWGYGSLTNGYSATDTDPASMDSPFALYPTDISSSDLLSALEQGAQQGWSAFVSDLENPSSGASLDTTSSTASFTDLLNALQADAADPSATLTELANAISSAGATLQGALTSLADIGNALATSAPAYELGLFTTNLASGDITDALGLPFADGTALDTLAGGFAFNVIENAATAISADFSSLF